LFFLTLFFDFKSVEEPMRNQKTFKSGIVISFTLLLVMSALGFLAESYSYTAVRTDGQIQGAALKRLEMDSRIDAHSLGVNVEDGHVKIFGMVDSLKEKDLASLIVGSLDGVTAIRNNLRIKPDLDEDRGIRLGIEQLIKIAGLKEINSIMVNVENGAVSLKGMVSSRKDKIAIQKIAENRPGVTVVKNLLTVKGIGRGDREIRKDVLFYLLWSPFFKKDEIQVEVQDGIVKLDGHIDFLGERNILAEDLGNIQGVERVNVENLSIIKKPENPQTKSS